MRRLRLKRLFRRPSRRFVAYPGGAFIPRFVNLLKQAIIGLSSKEVGIQFYWIS